MDSPPSYTAGKQLIARVGKKAVEEIINPLAPLFTSCGQTEVDLGMIHSLFPDDRSRIVYSLTADSSRRTLVDYINGSCEAPSFWQVAHADISGLRERFINAHVSRYSVLPAGEFLDDSVLVICDGSDDVNGLLQAARADYPDQPLYLKIEGEKNPPKSIDGKGFTLIDDEQSLAPLFQTCKAVYIGNSDYGAEALVYGGKVITYAWSFYSGWGLTEDRCSEAMPVRSRQLSLDEFFDTLYHKQAIYIDPDLGERCDLDRIISHIALQHEISKQTPDSYYSHKFDLLKKTVVPQFLPSAKYLGNRSQPLDSEIDCLVWGQCQLPDAFDLAKVTRVEDGFIRSRGLGAEFNSPISLVFDDLGIYFNAHSPSRIEQLLEEEKLEPEEIDEARELIDFLKANKVTKYQLGIEPAYVPEAAQSKTVILVPGQVDSDASIRYGSPKLKNNRELLDEVRRQNPDAFICYKPHPDLLAGARKDAPLWKGIEQQVDYLITSGDIISWIQAVDEVHTLTSTVGIEALLHEKPVFTYGLPFYAGWGLTTDWLHCERRNRKRTLEELVAIAYLRYPTYRHPSSGEFTTALYAAKILLAKEGEKDNRSTSLKLLNHLKKVINQIR